MQIQSRIFPGCVKNRKVMTTATTTNYYYSIRAFATEGLTKRSPYFGSNRRKSGDVNDNENGCPMTES
jgi:hypothetical protein